MSSDLVNADDGYTRVDGVAMRVRSVRMPEDVIAVLDTTEHPAGFSGIVREAVTEWLARHTGTVPNAEAEHALEVLKRFVQAA